MPSTTMAISRELHKEEIVQWSRILRMMKKQSQMSPTISMLYSSNLAVILTMQYFTSIYQRELD